MSSIQAYGLKQDGSYVKFDLGELARSQNLRLNQFSEEGRQSIIKVANFAIRSLQVLIDQYWQNMIIDETSILSCNYFLTYTDSNGKFEGKTSFFPVKTKTTYTLPGSQKSKFIDEIMKTKKKDKKLDVISSSLDLYKNLSGLPTIEDPNILNAYLDLFNTYVNDPISAKEKAKRYLNQKETEQFALKWMAWITSSFLFEDFRKKNDRIIQAYNDTKQKNQFSAELIKIINTVDVIYTKYYQSQLDIKHIPDADKSKAYKQHKFFNALITDIKGFCGSEEYERLQQLVKIPEIEISEEKIRLKILRELFSDSYNDDELLKISDFFQRGSNQILDQEKIAADKAQTKQRLEKIAEMKARRRKKNKAKQPKAESFSGKTKGRKEFSLDRHLVVEEKSPVDPPPRATYSFKDAIGRKFTNETPMSKQKVATKQSTPIKYADNLKRKTDPFHVFSQKVDEIVLKHATKRKISNCSSKKEGTITTRQMLGWVDRGKKRYLGIIQYIFNDKEECFHKLFHPKAADEFQEIAIKQEAWIQDFPTLEEAKKLEGEAKKRDIKKTSDNKTSDRVEKREGIQIVHDKRNNMTIHIITSDWAKKTV